jgi:hypothetical protein
MRFHDVVLCDYLPCGAILRIASTDPNLRVQLEEDARGWYFICPRCQRRTDVPDASDLRRTPRARPVQHQRSAG